VWDGVVGEKGWVYIYIWGYGDLMKIFSQENIFKNQYLFFGNGNFFNIEI